MIYSLTEAQVWTLLQLRQGRELRPLDPAAILQAANPDVDEQDELTLAYVPLASEAAVNALRQLAAAGPVTVFSPVPALLRDALALPAVPIEQVPNILLADFPRLIAGL